MINKIENKIKNLIDKLKFNDWSIKNPTSFEKIKNFFVNECKIFYNIQGFYKIIKKIDLQLENKKSLNWFNYFSEIRSAYFLENSGIKIKSFNKKNINNEIDLEFSNGVLCEVKSFEPKIISMPKDPNYDENFVLKKFLLKKIIPCFLKQKADLIIIDDIFSFQSKNYHFLNYFLEFIDEPRTERYKIIRKIMGQYLDIILIISFTSSLVLNPIIRYKGKKWNDLFK